MKDICERFSDILSVLVTFTVLVTLLRCIVNCCGLSYPGIMWPLLSEARVRSQGTRMAFSNIEGESVEGMKSN